ncbi:MAG TPA: hypothetical protein PKY12_10195, partial [Catalimonadaceae bacterium]|nr:hypothetical protein [Catalimonadaceae bacterium]
YLNEVDEVFPLLGMGLEFFPARSLRLELWGNFTPLSNGYTVWTRSEVGFRLHYNIWQKGFLNSSLHIGVSNQNYYDTLSFPSVDVGLNYFLSFSRFLPKTQFSSGPKEAGPEGF